MTLLPFGKATVIVTGVALATGCTSADTARNMEQPVTENGIGPARMGMTVKQLAGAVGPLDDDQKFYDESCYNANPRGRPDKLSFMVVDGVVVRLDVFDPKIKTDRGVGIGNSEDDIRAAYKDARTEPHFYTGDEGGHYLIVDLNEGKSAFVFETDGRVVKNYRVGRRPSVEAAEGCS